MNKYGMYILDEQYCGLDVSWERYTDLGIKPSRKQIVECTIKYIDYLSKFIKPSVLLDFAKALDDTVKGEERYNRLCENLSYVESLSEKARALSREFYMNFLIEVFGEQNMFDDSCHILLFPKQKDDFNLHWLIEDHESFKSWFLACLSKNKMLFSVLVQGISESDVVKADVVARLKERIRNLEYYKMQVAETKKEIEDELSRIDDSMVFEEDDKGIIEKAKEELR